MKAFVVGLLAVVLGLLVLAVVLTQRFTPHDVPAVGPKVTVASGSARGYHYRLVAYRGTQGNACLVVDAHKFLRVLGAVHTVGCGSQLATGKAVRIGFSSSGDIAFASGQVRADVASLRFHLHNATSFRAFAATRDAGFGVHFVIAVLPSGAGVADVTAIDALDSQGEHVGDLRCRAGFCG